MFFLPCPGVSLFLPRPLSISWPGQHFCTSNAILAHKVFLFFCLARGSHFFCLALFFFCGQSHSFTHFLAFASSSLLGLG